MVALQGAGVPSKKQCANEEQFVQPKTIERRTGLVADTAHNSVPLSRCPLGCTSFIYNFMQAIFWV